MSAFWKIPLQALVLLVGVLVFVYYLFVAPPLFWNPTHAKAVQAADPSGYVQLEREANAAWVQRYRTAEAIGRTPSGTPRDQLAGPRADFRTADSAYAAIRVDAMKKAEKATGGAVRDVNYIIPQFVLNELPIGLAGLFIAAVIAAAMSAVAGELSALSTCTVIDFYRRWVKPEASDAHFLAVSRGATAFWGVVACLVAVYAASLGSLIEVVNRFGSFFYGSILGVFILAMIPRARATGAFFGLVISLVAVGGVSYYAPNVSFLWYNVVAAGTAVASGYAISEFTRGFGENYVPPKG